MYTPPSFAETDRTELFAFIRAHPLGAIVTAANGELMANHLPLVLQTADDVAILTGHFSRANPQSRVADGVDALVIFSDPGGYVTPAWYPSKQEHGRVVPTWNYVAVHVHGRIELVDDAAFLRAQLDALTNQQEASQEQPWKTADAPAAYLEQQMKAIIGFRIVVERLEGKWKMSQNRSAADVTGVIEGFRGSDPRVGEIVAELNRKRTD